jgi:hypothetical protein
MNASDIISALPSSFEAARSSGDLFFFPSEVSKHEEIGVEVFILSLLSSQSTHSPERVIERFTVGDSPMYRATEETDRLRTYW